MLVISNSSDHESRVVAVLSIVTLTVSFSQFTSLTVTTALGVSRESSPHTD